LNETGWVNGGSAEKGKRKGERRRGETVAKSVGEGPAFKGLLVH
jgi:hypothetical protein